jgi:hypothetical protein
VNKKDLTDPKVYEYEEEGKTLTTLTNRRTPIPFGQRHLWMAA